MSDNEEIDSIEEKGDEKECLFNASQYLIISMISDLTDVRNHFSDGDGDLAVEAIQGMRENLGLLNRIAEDFIDCEAKSPGEVNMESSEAMDEESITDEEVEEVTGEKAE
jgi:hypothetical protein